MGLTIRANHMITALVLLDPHLAFRTLLNSKLFELFFSKSVPILPFPACVVWVRFLAVQAIRLSTDLAVNLFIFRATLSREYILTKSAGHIIFRIFGNKTRNLDIAYLLKLLFCDQSLGVIHIDRLLAFVIGTEQSFFLDVISEISQMISHAKPAECTRAIQESIRVLQDISTDSTLSLAWLRELVDFIFDVLKGIDISCDQDLSFLKLDFICQIILPLFHLFL